MSLTDAQRRALAVLETAHGPRGFYGVPCAALARALDTSEAGAARTASSLVRRGLAVRFVGGAGPRKVVHYQRADA